MDHPEHSEQDVRSALSESRYFLDRWRFAVSARGILWVQPTGPTLTPEELAGLFALLHRGCEETFPSVMLLDLGDVDVVGQQWTSLVALIQDFSKTIGAQYRLISGSERPISAACIYRHQHV